MKPSEIERLLPTVLRRTARPSNPLPAILEVMSVLHKPSETMMEGLDSIFNPFRTSDLFVPFLARWLDLERIFDETTGPARNNGARSPITTGLEALRALIGAASYLSQWRGTKK